MQRWQGLDEVPDGWGPSVVTIGRLRRRAPGPPAHRRPGRRGRARELGLPVVVVTFDPHPDEVVRPGAHPPLLCTARRRAELLAGLGVDAVCVLPFTRAFSELGPDEFVRAVLVDRLHAARVVVGEDFRFGHRAAGDVALLAELGEKYDFTAEGVPLLADNGVRISSSDDQGAAGRRGRGRRGQGPRPPAPGRGRGGARPPARPGARLPDRQPGDRCRTPRSRPTASTRAGWSASTRRAASRSAGRRRSRSAPTRPSTGGERSVEAYVLDRDDLDLYGVHVAVDFVARLRGMVRFDSVDDLIAQMHRDAQEARAAHLGD